MSILCALPHRNFIKPLPCAAKMPPKTPQNSWLRALGQRFNAAGIAAFVSVVVREPHLALPHAAVPDARWIDWTELHRLGFKGVVFDKDNTLTAPYSLSLWPPLSESLRLCCNAFPGKVAVFSNSAGLRQYDPEGLEAEALEKSIGGVHVIRHGKWEHTVHFLLKVF